MRLPPSPSRALTVWLPSPAGVTGPLYGSNGPPSTLISTPDDVVVVAVIVGLVRYQPLAGTVGLIVNARSEPGGGGGGSSSPGAPENVKPLLLPTPTLPAASTAWTM